MHDRLYLNAAVLNLWSENLPGGPQARPNVYLILRYKYAKRNFFPIFQFFSFESLD